MKKLLTVTLVFVFTCALVFALGCNQKKAEEGMEGSQPMEQTSPPAGGMTDSTGAMMQPDTTGGMGAGH